VTDDFGFTPDVNQGIVEAHRHGILTATTLMANGAAFDDALRLARQFPPLDIGCHLVLIGGRSLVTQKPFPVTVPRLVAALASREIRPYDELKAQVRRIVDAGVRPSHLDTHKHTTWPRPFWTRWRGWARSSVSGGCAGPSIFRSMRWRARCRARSS
jgi:predicted glycoside hydrolase/deacetylase ChbG (UPF0249 family)